MGVMDMYQKALRAKVEEDIFTLISCLRPHLHHPHSTRLLPLLTLPIACPPIIIHPVAYCLFIPLSASNCRAGPHRILGVPTSSLTPWAWNNQCKLYSKHLLRRPTSPPPSPRRWGISPPSPPLLSKPPPQHLPVSSIFVSHRHFLHFSLDLLVVL
jgi:hypothetical protein